MQAHVSARAGPSRPFEIIMGWLTGAPGALKSVPARGAQGTWTAD